MKGVDLQNVAKDCTEVHETFGFDASMGSPKRIDWFSCLLHAPRLLASSLERQDIFLSCADFCTRNWLVLEIFAVEGIRQNFQLNLVSSLQNYALGHLQDLAAGWGRIHFVDLNGFKKVVMIMHMPLLQGCNLYIELDKKYSLNTVSINKTHKNESLIIWYLFSRRC